MDISWNHTLLTATAIISEKKHARRREGNFGILPKGFKGSKRGKDL